MLFRSILARGVGTRRQNGKRSVFCRTFWTDLSGVSAVRCAQDNAADGTG